MSNAAVLIGVNRTGGGLPVLQDATNSARRMERWAKAQGFEHVRTFTDEDDAGVHVKAIKDAVKELSQLGTVEKLVVFFAGHGVNVRRNEYWLLSDAPDDPQEAVNVRGSVDLAQYGGIPYVVMISDACRTAADTVTAQTVSGSEIFPNQEVAESALPVDQFYACRLGRPSHEIRDSRTTAKEYKAIYTAALMTALEGRDPSVLDGAGYVRPSPLKKFLQTEVARRLRDLELHTKLIQVPDALISEGDKWIAHIPQEGGGGEAAARRGVTDDGEELGPTARTVIDGMLGPVLDGRLETFGVRVRETQESDEPRIVDIATSVKTTASPFGPTHFETGCGFKIRGARVRRALGAGIRAERLDDGVVRMHPSGDPGGTVLLEFDDGHGVALPAINDFITAVTVEDGEVLDVAYEPSEYSYRWPEFEARADEIRALRGVAASASREGAFELEGEDAVEVARRMQVSKGIDPGLAVYAAHAYADHGRRDLIRQMQGAMRDDLGGVLFDIALLARTSDHDRLFGLAPLLAQGWALLPTGRLSLPPALAGLERHVLPDSLWTVYDADGVERIRRAIEAKEVT